MGDNDDSERLEAIKKEYLDFLDDEVGRSLQHCCTHHYVFVVCRKIKENTQN